MGKAIAEAVAQDGSFALDPDQGDVIVDFSAPDALASSLDRAMRAAVPILIGTTGLDDLADRRIAEASRSPPRSAFAIITAAFSSTIAWALRV